VVGYFVFTAMADFKYRKQSPLVLAKAMEIVSPELDTTALDHQKQVLVQNASEDVDNDDDIACFRNIHVLVNYGTSLHGHYRQN